MAITFDNIAGGELSEKFKMALAQIGRNILDPNMDPEVARGMTINLKFKPKKAGTIDIDRHMIRIRERFMSSHSSTALLIYGPRQTNKLKREGDQGNDGRIKRGPGACRGAGKAE